MTRITVLGGTGYAGSNIVAVAAARGHEVVAYSRTAPDAPVQGVDYRTGDVQDISVLATAVEETDVVISALSPRGELSKPGAARDVLRRLRRLAGAAEVRLGVVGGAGSLLTEEGGGRLVDTPEFSEEYKPEALEMAGALDDLRASGDEADWFYVSPAGDFGPWVPGEHTGVYRIGGDVLLKDAQGRSAISGADFAEAIVKEIEQPAHRRARFTVAY